MINVVILEGNLGQNPEFIALQNGNKLAKLSLAVQKSYRDKNGNWNSSTSWTELTCYSEYTQQKIEALKKGDHIIIEGEFGTNEYTDNQGIKHNNPQIKISEIKKIEKTPAQNQNTNFNNNNYNNQQQPNGYNNQPNQQRYNQNQYNNQNQQRGYNQQNQNQQMGYNQNQQNSFNNDPNNNPYPF